MFVLRQYFFGMMRNKLHWTTASERVFVFPGPRPFAWPSALALAPNLYLPALAPNLYLLALAPNLYLPAQPALSLYIPSLPPEFVFTGPGL